MRSQGDKRAQQKDIIRAKAYFEDFKTRATQESGNVFLDIGLSTGEAQNLHLRSELMNKIEHFVRSSGLTQMECAVRMGVTQPRLNELLKGKIDKFSRGALVTMLGHAGMRVRLLVKNAA